MRISYLLKYDWDRAKQEASSFSFLWRYFRYKKVKRCKFNSKCY